MFGGRSSSQSNFGVNVVISFSIFKPNFKRKICVKMSTFLTKIIHNSKSRKKTSKFFTQAFMFRIHVLDENHFCFDVTKLVNFHFLSDFCILNFYGHTSN